MLATQKTIFQHGSPAVLVNVPSKANSLRREVDGDDCGTVPTKASICKARTWAVMTLGELLLTHSVLQQQDLQEHNHIAPLGMLPVCSTDGYVQNKQ